MGQTDGWERSEGMECNGGITTTVSAKTVSAKESDHPGFTMAWPTEPLKIECCGARALSFVNNRIVK